MDGSGEVRWGLDWKGMGEERSVMMMDGIGRVHPPGLAGWEQDEDVVGTYTTPLRQYTAFFKVHQTPRLALPWSFLLL